MVKTTSDSLQHSQRPAASSVTCCRYCEFNSRPDPTRGASWNKIAASLLVVHCSQYVLALDSGRFMIKLVQSKIMYR